MNATAQLAEIRERIAQMPETDRNITLALATDITGIVCNWWVASKYNTDKAILALALVSAEMAAEVKP